MLRSYLRVPAARFFALALHAKPAIYLHQVLKCSQLLCVGLGRGIDRPRIALLDIRLRTGAPELGAIP